MYPNARLALLGLAAAALLCPSLRADFITIAQPTSAYTSSTTLLDFSDPGFRVISMLSGGGETLSYDNLLVVLTYPSTVFADWGSPPATETSTPRIGYTGGLSDTRTISLSKPASRFGLEIETQGYATYTGEKAETTADFYSGSKLVGSIGRFVDAFDSGGALLFAASTSTDPFTSVVITAPPPKDFAIARQRFTLASVPEPSSFFLLGSALGGALAFVRRSRERS
jgi:PEP-CTERM motif